MVKRSWLTEYRGDKTQEEISVEIGISRSLYTQIETGQRNPSVNTAKKIAQFFGFDWTIFFMEKCHETQQRQAI